MRRSRVTAALTAACLGLLAPGTASADHTDPGTLLSPLLAQPSTGALEAGEGEWELIANLGPMQGTDLELFTKDGIQYVSAGTLGQAQNGTPAFVGQRIVQLTDATGEIAPKVVADHGSARCAINTSATGLQHDVQAVPVVDTQFLVDTTDAVGRCHDTPGGGIEIIDVSDLGKDGFEPREISLIRFNGLSHTVTADATRPGILYNNQADFAATTWIDVVDARSCLGLSGKTLEQKRALCKPVVYRFDYADTTSSKVLPDGTLGEPASCHDITAAPNRLYCAGLNASFVVDVSGLFDATGKPKGTPLPCTVVDGTATGAKVTDCALKPKGVTSASPTAAQSIAAYEELGKPAAEGAKVLTTVNHPGRNCSPVPANAPDNRGVACNTNTVVRSDEGVAVSHENDPALGGRYMLVTDERGGGVIPPGSTCSPGLDNPVGNGGLHVFDISDPAKPTYAQTPEGEKAIYIGTSPTPSPTFCTIHVIEQIPGEARIVAAYYDGGTKIVDYTVDADGRWTFEETAAYRLPGANTWASEVFEVQKNADGTNTYYFVSTSFALGEGTARGIDVFSWTGPANLLADAVAQPGAAAPAPGQTGSECPDPSGDGCQDPETDEDAQPRAAGGSLPATGADLALAALAAVLLPLAFVVRRVRRRLDLAV